MNQLLRATILVGLLACGAVAAGCVDKDEGKTTVVVDEGEGHAEHSESHEGESEAEHAAHAEHEGDSAAEHAGHAEHDEGEADSHAGHAHTEAVKLGPEVLKEYGVVVAAAKPGKLQDYLTLPGEVAIDPDKLSHVVTPISGVITAAHKNIGDSVKRGDLMLELESTELADAKSAYLQAVEHRKLAQSTFEREEMLWQLGVSAEQEYLAARNALAEADITVNGARQSLLALKVSQGEIDMLSASSGMSLTKYKVYAQAGGIVVDKHASRGELLTPDRDAFTLADLSAVFVRLSVHQRDLEKIKVGQQVVLDAPDGKTKVNAKVDFIEPIIGEESRQAVARVRLSNPGGSWRPGLFVTGRVMVSADDAAVLVPQEALQTVEGKTVVFVEDEHGFAAREVTLGRQNDTHVEITRGLSPGEKYVVENAFLVKAELAKATAAHEH